MTEQVPDNESETRKQKVKARQHDSYTALSVLAFLIPLVGFIIGIVYVTKKDKLDRKLGEHLIAMSILFGIVGLIFWSVVISAADNSTNQVVTSPATSSNSTNTSKLAPQTAKVGDTLMIGGDQGVAVTLSQIIDPASSDNQYATPDAGTHYVATKIVVTNKGAASYQDDANENVTIIGSDNQSYTFNIIASTAGCTNFSNGQYTLAPGASATGCVTFQLPNSVSAAKVQFTGNNGLLGNTAEWVAQ